MPTKSSALTIEGFVVCAEWLETLAGTNVDRPDIAALHHLLVDVVVREEFWMLND